MTTTAEINHLLFLREEYMKTWSERGLADNHLINTLAVFQQSASEDDVRLALCRVKSAYDSNNNAAQAMNDYQALLVQNADCGCQ